METVGLDLLFDSAGFSKGVDQAFASMNKLSGAVTGAIRGVKGLALGFIGIQGLSSVWGKITSVIPAMGQMFSQMGNIISRNLFAPLAKEIFPIIKDLFAWVRDNRIVFVQLGTVLVSIFRAAKTIVLGFWEAIKGAIQSFAKSIGVAQIGVGDFINFINFILLKVVFIFTFIGLLLEPLIVFIGGLLGQLFKNVIEPFVSTMIPQYLQGLGELFGFLAELLEELGISGGGDLSFLKDAVIAVATAVGFLFKLNVRLFIDLIKGIKLGVLFVKMLWSSFLLVYGVVKRLFVELVTPMIEWYNKGKEIVAAFWNLFAAPGSFIINKIRSVLTGIIDAIRSVINGLVSPLVEIAERFKQAIINAFKSAWEAVKNTQVGKTIVRILTPSEGEAEQAQADIDAFRNEAARAPAVSRSIQEARNITDNRQQNQTNIINIQSTDPQEAASETQRRLRESYRDQVNRGQVNRQ